MSKRKAMSNNELLETFRRIVEGHTEMPQEATNEMMFAAIVDTRRGVSKMDAKMDTVCEDVRTIRENDLPHLTSQIEEVDKRFKENPSLLWLFRHRTSKTIKFFIGVVTTLIIIIYVISAVPAVQRIIAAIIGLE